MSALLKSLQTSSKESVVISSSMLLSPVEFSGADPVLSVFMLPLVLLTVVFSGAYTVLGVEVTLFTQSEKRSTGFSRAGQRLVFLMASCLMQLARTAELEAVRWMPSLKQPGVSGLGSIAG